MKETLEPIIYIALTIFAVGGAIMMPMVVYAAYRDLIKGK
jgi:hypothetical protein